MRPRDLLAAISLANLVYLRCWAEILTLNRRDYYWMKSPPTPAHFIALILNVALLALLIAGMLPAWHRRKGAAFRVAPVFGLLILATMVNSLQTLIRNPGDSLFLRFVEQRAPAIGVALAMASVVALIFGGTHAFRPAYFVLLLLSPLPVFCAAQACYRIFTYDPSLTADGPLAARLPGRPAGSPRVVWIVFDEWDERLTFSERYPGVRLPEIDRLRAASFYASDAIRAHSNTDWAMPALTTGIAVDNVFAGGPAELMVLPEGSRQWIPWSRQPNVFDKARDLGYNTAVVGWAIPYCRVLKSSLTACWWWSGSDQYNSTGTSVFEIMLHQPRSLLENVSRSPFGQSLSTHSHERVYESVLAQSLEVVSDPGYGLTMLHLPIPHPPYFYNAATGANDRGDTPVFGIWKQTQQGYLDALVLVDKTLARLRGAMERAGVWDGTTVICSADHPYRHREKLDGKPGSVNVPLLIKAAGQNEAIRYDTPFSALLTQKLILAFLGGELSRAGQIPAWLDTHRAEYPVR